MCKSCQTFSASRIDIASLRNVPSKNALFHEIFAGYNNNQPLWQLLRILWIFPSEIFQLYFCENLCRLQQRSTSVAAAQTTTPCTWTPRNINHLVLPSLVLFWFFCNSHLNWIDWERISLKLASKQLSVKRFFLPDINFDYCKGGRRVWRIWTNNRFHPSKISEDQLNCRAEELFQTIYRSL